MNTLKTFFCSSCMLFCMVLSAQKKQSTAELPYSKKSEVKSQSLEAIFQSTEKVSVDLSSRFRLEGKVRNKTDHGNSVTTMLIQVESEPGGMLSISRYKDEQGRLHYSGHLLRLHDADGFLLVENDRGYYLIKTQQRFLISE